MVVLNAFLGLEVSIASALCRTQIDPLIIFFLTYNNNHCDGTNKTLSASYTFLNEVGTFSLTVVTQLDPCGSLKGQMKSETLLRLCNR